MENEKDGSRLELIAFYEHANNSRLLTLKPAMRVTWRWDIPEYSYTFPVAYRGA